MRAVFKGIWYLRCPHWDGKLTLNWVLEGNHYVRSFHGMIMLSDMINSLAWETFWQWLALHGRNINDDVMVCASEVQKTLCEKKLSHQKFDELVGQSAALQEQFLHFLKDSCEKSELCQYLQVFLQMTGIIKHAVASDREGNFSVIIDFMSRIRSFQNLATFVTFKRAIGGSINLFQDKYPHCFWQLPRVIC